MRPSRQQMFMEIAQVVAKRSTCVRLNVGAIITLDNRIISIGYNGQAPGEPHCQGNDCQAMHTPGTCNTIHAEANALEYMPFSGGGRRLAMYVTDSPCKNCADLIIDAMVDVVYFGKAYRDTSPLDHLALQCEVYQVTPAGYTIDWLTKKVVV